MLLFKCIVIAVAVITPALCRSTTNTASENAIHEEPRSQESSYFGDFRYVYKVYQECAVKDLAPCLKLKLISAMDRAARNFADITLIEGVTFVKDPNAAAENEIKTEAELEATLPRSMNERDSALNTLIVDKITRFFDTHSLQVKLPSASELQRSFSEEGRGKKKKGGGMLLLPLILGGTLIPLALGALALLAGKALIVSKLALVLAGIIGLKKLLSGSNGGGGDSGHEVVVQSGHGSGWGRSYEKSKEQAQNMAYSAYVPKTAR